MIEKKILTYLKSILTDVSVFVGEKPKSKPNEYVVLKVIENGRENQIDAVSFYCESYSTTLQKAAELSKRVKDAMFSAVSLDDVASVRLGGGGQNIDSATKTYCYEAVFNLFYYDEEEGD